MNRFLINCAWDIMDLGKANGVDNSVARDMFVENLNTFGTDHFSNYPGAEVDYAALSAAWKAMSQSEQAAAKTACIHPRRVRCLLRQTGCKKAAARPCRRLSD